MAEGRDDLEAEAAHAAFRIEGDHLAVQQLDRRRRPVVQQLEELGVVQGRRVDVGEIGMC